MPKVILTGFFVCCFWMLLGQTKSNLTINTTGTSNLKIKLGEYRYSFADRSETFHGLTPGSYNLEIYQLQKKTDGSNEYFQVYNNTINLTAGKHLEITVLRFGKVVWDEGNIVSDTWSNSYNNPSPLGSNSNNNNNNSSSWKVMDTGEFAKVKNRVNSEYSIDTKLAVAKASIKNFWITTNQVKELCQTFYSEDYKVALAKYAYDNCSDKGEYLSLLEIFYLSANKKELLDYINSK